MKSYIKSRVIVEGVHCWPFAPKFEKSMALLASPHRHQFYIELCKKVRHDDRDIEFIQFGHMAKAYLEKHYPRHASGALDFGKASCEMLAKELCKAFKCDSVGVYEDGENGAEVVA